MLAGHTHLVQLMSLSKFSRKLFLGLSLKSNNLNVSRSYWILDLKNNKRRNEFNVYCQAQIYGLISSLPTYRTAKSFYSTPVRASIGVYHLASCTPMSDFNWHIEGTCYLHLIWVPILANMFCSYLWLIRHLANLNPLSKLCTM